MAVPCQLYNIYKILLISRQILLAGDLLGSKKLLICGGIIVFLQDFAYFIVNNQHER